MGHRRDHHDGDTVIFRTRPPSGFNTINPKDIPGLKLWIDAHLGVTGIVNGVLNSIVDQSDSSNNLSNISGVNRPIYANQDRYTNGMNIFRRGRADGRAIDLEGGNDWLSLDGTSSGPFIAFAAETATIWHVSKHTSNRSTATEITINTPLNIICRNDGSTYGPQVGFSSGRPQFIIYDVSWNTYSATRTNLNDGQLHTVCWTINNTTLTCYIDGALDSVITTVGAMNTAFAGVNSIGGHALNDGFQGYIGEVMIWDKVLTSQQVVLLHTRAMNIHA